MSNAGRASPGKPSKLISAALLRQWPLPDPRPAGDKEGRGSVLVVGGSVQVPGAVILAATAALRAGAGKAQIATCRSVAALVAVAVPEARVMGLGQSRGGELAPDSCRAIRRDVAAASALLVGPGMFDGRAAIRLLRDCAKASQPGPALVIDAGALAVFQGRKALGSTPWQGIIATPHAGEMATLWGTTKGAVVAKPEETARRAAAELGAIVVLKGARTFIATPAGTSFHNTAGNGGLATSGSGDALCGIIAGLCARGADPVQAAVWGVFLHARAGEMLARKVAPMGYLAREILAAVPGQMARLGR